MAFVFGLLLVAPPKPVTGSTGPASLILSGGPTMVISQSETVGRIVLSDNASIVVTGSQTKLTVEGGITINGGSFEVDGASLVMPQTYSWEFPLQVLGNSNFTLLHATVNTGGWIWLGYFYGNSTTVITDSTIRDPNTLGAFIAYGATFDVANSTLGGDIQLQSGPGIPNNSHVKITGSGGFDILVCFPSGSTANATFPSVNPANDHLTRLSWSFPGSSNVTGIGYTVILTNDLVWHVGAYLWPHSDVTLRNSANINIAFFFTSSTESFSGFHDEHYGSFQSNWADYRLDLYNVTVQQITWYPENGSHLFLTNVDVGQVIPMMNSTAYIADSNFTGLAGPLSSVDTSRVTIVNSSIYALVEAQSSASITVVNCSIHQDTLRKISVGVEANGNSLITLIGSRVDTGLSLATQQNGVIDVKDPVYIGVALPAGGPAANASVTARWVLNGSIAATAYTNAAGMAELDLSQYTVSSSGTNTNDDYVINATLGGTSGSAQAVVSSPQSVTVDLGTYVSVPPPSPSSPGSDVGVIIMFVLVLLVFLAILMVVLRRRHSSKPPS